MPTRRERRVPRAERLPVDRAADENARPVERTVPAIITAMPASVPAVMPSAMPMGRGRGRGEGGCAQRNGGNRGEGEFAQHVRLLEYGAGGATVLDALGWEKAVTRARFAFTRCDHHMKPR